MSLASTSAAQGCYRLEWDGSFLELEARRVGLRTQVVLLRDGHAVGAGTGVGQIKLPLPMDAGQPAGGPERPEPTPPSVLVLSVVPGVISTASLLVPRPRPAADCTEMDGLAELGGVDAAERHPFEPPQGTLAFRLWAFQRTHPRLYAARHVALAVGEVVFGVLGVALLIQLDLWRVVSWIVQRLPRFQWPAIAWPDIELPSIPWPDIDWPDLPDLSLPGWLLAVIATAKYWVPILIAIGVAAHEIDRRTNKRSTVSGRSIGRARRDQAGPADPVTSEPAERSSRDAHR